MKKVSKQSTGKLGEEIAARWLQSAGYAVVARNYHVGHDELDIIARQDDLIVFVEVKTARTKNFGEPELWVDEQKQQRVGRAAETYLAEHDLHEVDCRFDVITVDLSTKPPRINHIEDAFWLDE